MATGAIRVAGRAYDRGRVVMGDEELAADTLSRAARFEVGENAPKPAE